MTSTRIADKGLNADGRTLRFSFDGKNYAAREGDTLAAALMANDVAIAGRSFKYHRPRGFWGAWSEDPNGIADIDLNGDRFPNCQMTTTYVTDGMQVRSVNGFPSAQFDLKRGLDLFSRFMPAGFYYKTFMWPNWHLFEPAIRKMAGLGRVSDKPIDSYRSAQHHDSCDLLVVGGGACGLVAARAAAEAGRKVILADDQAVPGGSLYATVRQVEGQPCQQWVAEQLAACQAAGANVMTRTTALGVHDHSLVSLAREGQFGSALDLWRIRARQILLATGAIERPLQFANNDLPGIMSAHAAAENLGRYGVLAGRDIALLSNNSRAEGLAQIFEEAGAKIHLLDGRQGSARAAGGKRATRLTLGATTHRFDSLLVSGGYTPSLHLWCHANGKLTWDAGTEAFLPGEGPQNIQVTGGANGIYDLETALADARARALPDAGLSPNRSAIGLKDNWQAHTGKGRKWVDYQSDVTTKDVKLAAGEGFQSVEHLKRYTTLGMSTDQGKTSNLPGLMTLAETLEKPVPEVGTTRFRPPYSPVPLETFSGPRRGTGVNPLRRLVLEPQHRALNAALGEYGGTLRPGWYGDQPAGQAVQSEVSMARKSVALCDGSPLGKIEVIGPDAAEFLDFIYYNTISTLKPGRIRYGFMLRETGTIFDDGVVARLGENHFVISCSSSHVESVTLWLESWRQDLFNRKRIYIHNMTQGWATVIVTGPKARNVVASLNTGADLSRAALPHMAFASATFRGQTARVARVSFTGDLSFEISVPNSVVTDLWTQALETAGTLGGGPIGVEALAVLRAQKGYIITGKDTDGETMPHDLGFGGPRDKKHKPFVGDRSLHSEFANRTDRLQLVGLAVAPGAAKLPTGANATEERDGRKRSIGFVTSSYDVDDTGTPVALALIAGGQSRIGQPVDLWHLGETLTAQIVTPVFLDPEGARLNA